MVDGGIPIMAIGHVFFGSRRSLVPCTTYSYNCTHLLFAGVPGRDSNTGMRTTGRCATNGVFQYPKYNGAITKKRSALSTIMLRIRYDDTAYLIV
jgi:hypothetical protein